MWGNNSSYSEGEKSSDTGNEGLQLGEMRKDKDCLWLNKEHLSLQGLNPSN